MSKSKHTQKTSNQPRGKTEIHRHRTSVNIVRDFVVSGNSVFTMNVGEYRDYSPLIEKIQSCLEIIPPGTLSEFTRLLFIQYAEKNPGLPKGFEKKATALIELFDALDKR